MDNELIERNLENFQLRQSSRAKEALLSETLKQIETNREKIVELEKLRDDLTGMIVHDIKNPLSGAMTAIDLLLSGSLGPLTAEQKKFIGYAKVGNNRILSIVNSLLDVQRLTENKLALKKSSFAASELVSNLDWVNGYVQGEEKKLVFSVENDLMIFGDKEIITRVLANLLTNSIKHTPRGGQITLRITKSSEARRAKEDALRNETLFEVIDTGEGIPKEYLDRLFERFFKVESQKFKTKIDTGLGLNFCKLAVEAHGGKIWVESEPNKGSKFSFTLPENDPHPKEKLP